MMRATKRAVTIAAVLLSGVLAVSFGQSAAAAKAAPTHTYSRVCSNAVAGSAACMSWVRTDVGPNASTPSGLFPADLRSAYNLTTSGSSSQTIAIVDAYDDPTAEADLGVYRAQFGLPACTTANGCFRKVDQNGGTRYPKKNGGWAQEISLDLDMVSAICPNCHILLVESNTNSFVNLGAAVNRAASGSSMSRMSL